MSISIKKIKLQLKNYRHHCETPEILIKKSSFILLTIILNFLKHISTQHHYSEFEAAGTSAYTLPPEGLQVLDELVFSDDASDQKDKIVTITDILYNNYNNFYLNSQTKALK